MDNVRFHAHLHPDRVAITDITFEREWTYEAFDRQIAQCVELLAQSGIGEGDRVACLSVNRAEVICLHMACARLGAIFVPLNWRLSNKEIKQLIDDCEPALTYADREVEGVSVEAIKIDELFQRCETVLPQWGEQKPAALPSLMLYTSGTTGKPKGVMLSEKNLFEIALNTTLLCEVDQDSCFLVESPMFHVIGMVTGVRAPLMVGGRVAISDAFVPERTFARLADESLKISHYFCVPIMAAAIKAAENFEPAGLQRLKAVFTGGAPLPESQVRDWLRDDLVIVDGFGMSEVGTTFGMPLDPALIERKAGCVGISTPRVRARIVSDDGTVVPDGVPGELEIQGENVMVGYWRREEEYQAAFSADGWFRTGDIMMRDDEGFFRVTDRKKDMFISGGENVYPVEVEAALDEFPGVTEIAVIGVPDAKWGEVGCLFYVVQDGTAAEGISLEAIEDYLDERLAKYKIPKQIRMIDSLPRTGVGKLKRHELRSIYHAEGKA